MNAGFEENQGCRGRQAVMHIRVSGAHQADYSPSDQRELLMDKAARLGLTVVGEVVEEGVTGSVPGARSVFDELLLRKQTRNDFDVLLVQDSSRLTRSGPQHGNHLEYILATEGIEVVYADEAAPRGPYQSTMRSLSYDAAREHARKISMSATRGAQSALEQGRTAYSRVPPYGIDRLYKSADGKPLYVLRNLADGSQLKLDPKTGEVIHRFAPRPKKGATTHNLKHPSECVELIPGDPARVAIVREIFHAYFVERRGIYRIARSLNERKVPSPSGGRWGLRMVHQMLRNPIYTGISIANRWSTSVYHERSPKTPKAIEVPLKVLAKYKRPPRRVRPRAEWEVRDEPQLAGLLDPEVRELARARQAAQLEAEAMGRKPKPNKDRHRESDFILKGLLRSRQGNHPMTGRSSGKKKSRRYKVSRGSDYPGTDPILTKLVNADAVEGFVLGIIEKVLRAGPDLRGLVERQVAVQRKVVHADATDIAELDKKLGAIAKRIGFIVRNLDAIGAEAAERELAEAKREREELEARRRSGDGPVREAWDDSRTVEETLAKLQDFGRRWRELPRAQVRALLEALVARLVVDLETGQLEMALRLPQWGSGALGEVRLESNPSCSGRYQAHAGAALPLLRFKGVVLPRRGGWTVMGFGVAA